MNLPDDLYRRGPASSNLMRSAEGHDSAQAERRIAEKGLLAMRVAQSS